ncbi:MAG: hypothetical protein IJO63_05570 [Bacilli bacterium]|nr:hypothetical protein [Bacilli bacterium]
MKKKLGMIILIVLLVIITVFLAFVVISKQNDTKPEFNIKKGDVIKFEEDDIEITVLNVASTLCDNKDTCISEGEVEVSIRVDYDGNISSYALKSVNNPEERIKNSNYFVNLKHEEGKLEINIREK